MLLLVYPRSEKAQGVKLPHKHIHTSIYTHKHTHISIHKNIYTKTDRNRRIHTNIYTYTYTHKLFGNCRRIISLNVNLAKKYKGGLRST